eukprot:1789558-Amphidinium_carterae.1
MLEKPCMTSSGSAKSNFPQPTNDQKGRYQGDIHTLTPNGVSATVLRITWVAGSPQQPSLSWLYMMRSGRPKIRERFQRRGLLSGQHCHSWLHPQIQQAVRGDRLEKRPSIVKGVFAILLSILFALFASVVICKQQITNAP